MRFRDRPLLVDGLDAALYLDRPDLERRVVEPLAAGGNVLLLGEAGSGKSTVLRKAAAGLARPERPAVIVNAGLADDAAGLLELVRGALGGEHDDRGDPAGERPGSGGPGLLRAVRRLRRDPPAVILVDGLVDPDAGYDLFGRLRDELWGLGHAWAVAARPRDSAPLRTPPADAFWSAVVEIPPLGDEEIGRLLRLGLAPDELARLDRTRPLAPAHPRQVIRAAREALEPDRGGAGAAAEAQLARAAALGRSEALAAAELQDLGRPVSAHDPDLLGRLSWSRPYAQRILANLEEHGVVRSIPERSDRPGRPRKLYELDPTPPPR